MLPATVMGKLEYMNDSIGAARHPEAEASNWLTTVLRVAGTLDQPTLDQLRPVLRLLALSCDLVILDLSAATVASPPAVARGLLPPAAELDRAGRCLLLRGAPPELVAELSRMRVPAVALTDEPVSWLSRRLLVQKRRCGGRKRMGDRDQADPYRLERFVAAQDRGGTYQRALAEIRAGEKRSHWMWFIFPQIAGLGWSPMAREYAISSAAEASGYLAHPALGPRLAECAAALLSVEGKSAQDIFGPVDAMKLRSSITLFHAVAGPGEPWTVLSQVLQKFFAGAPDDATLKRL